MRSNIVNRFLTILNYGLLVAAAYGLFATIVVNIRTNAYSTGLFFVGIVALSVMTWRYRIALIRCLQWFFGHFDIVSARWVLSFSLLLGCIARLWWSHVYPPVFLVEYAEYIELARALATGHPYIINGDYAFLSPGMPLVLAPYYAVLGHG